MEILRLWLNLPVVASLIFASGGMSAYEGITHVSHPTPLADPAWNYVVLDFAFIFEEMT